MTIDNTVPFSRFCDMAKPEREADADFVARIRAVAADWRLLKKRLGNPWAPWNQN